MTEFVEIPLGCPYHEFAPTIDLTCEEGLCGYIRQPINVITSLAHLVVAFYLYKIGRSINSKAHINIGIIASLIAFASMAAHATHMKLFGTFDFTLQYLFMAHLIWVNASRIGRNPPFRLWPFSLMMFFMLTILQTLVPEVSVGLYALMLTSLLVIEFLCYRQRTTQDSWIYTPLLKCAGLFAVGLICFFLDAEKIVCDPNNHYFQMHAVWHLLTAWSLVFLAKFYHQHEYHFR